MNKLILFLGGILLAVGLNGCATLFGNKHCVKTETRTVSVSSCARYSQTGHCAHYTTTSQLQDICVAWECDEGYRMDYTTDKCVEL